MSDLEKPGNGLSPNERNAGVVSDEQLAAYRIVHDKQLAAYAALSTAVNEEVDFGGYILDATQLGVAGQALQTASDGRTILIPQPSTDANDPLNWSNTKKNLMLLTIAVVAFMPDFASSIAIVTLITQAK